MRAPRLTRWAAGAVVPVALLALVPLMPAARPRTSLAAPDKIRAGTHSALFAPAAPAGALTTGPSASGLLAAPASAVLTGAPTWPLTPDCTAPDDGDSTGATDGAVHEPPGDRFSPITDLGSHLRVRRAYAVRAGRLVPVDGVAGTRPCDADLWRVVLTATPARVRPHVAELVVFGGADDSPAGRLLGDVEPARDDPGRWRLSLRLDAADSHELLLTIAHEVAHLVSLADDEMDRGHTGRDCPTYLTVTGCLRSDSLLLGFLEDTWTTRLFQEWARADEQPSEPTRLARLDAFYDRHRADFVTPYAASAPEEDLAESWASWCVDGPAATRDARAKTDWVGRIPPDRGAAAGCTALRRLAARS